jgi:hypothetical protein
LSTNADKAKISSAKYDEYLATAAAKADSLKYVGQRQISVDDSLYSEPSNAPETYSWATSAQTNPSISVTIPVSGSYYIRVRPYWNGTSTTATVTINGTVEANVPVFSVGLRAIQDASTVYNTFTVLSAEDPRIWITEYTSPEKITHYNDDYSSQGGDFSWGLNSRIKKQFPRPVDAILLSSFSTYNPAGVAEVYAKCQMLYFPNLKADDAIQSDPASSVYNCISWSGGITDYWEWPPSPSSAYYVPGKPLASFDLFYISERYPGCGVFVRAGATSGNSVIDLWATGSPNSYDYTHASIKKGADGNPHGYDWESKPGSLMRTFHPRTALSGSSYGNIVEYYKNVGTWTTTYTLAEAIADSKAVLENVRFNDAEISLIENDIANLSPDDVNTFQALFIVWKSTLESTPFSNPYSFKNSQYESLFAFCQSKQDLISLVYDKLSEEQFAILLVEDLTLSNNERNQSILDSIRISNKQVKTTNSGATIVRSPHSNMVKYVKALLAERTNKLRAVKNSTGLNNDIRYSNEDDINITNNGAGISINFTLSEKAKVSLSIVNLRGEEVVSLLSNKQLQAGKHNYSLNLTKGIYLVKQVVNGNVNVKKAILN